MLCKLRSTAITTKRSCKAINHRCEYAVRMHRKTDDKEVLNNLNPTNNKKLFHIVNFRFREMLKNWFTATVDIIVTVYAYLFIS